MVGSILGNSVRRVEDPALLIGAGPYVADIVLDGALVAAFVRSPYPHAEITRIECDAVRSMPGIVAVLNSDDIGIAELPLAFGRPMHPALIRPALARDRVRFAGEPVVIVVADTLGHSLDGTEMIEVEYRQLKAVADIEDSLAPDAPLQFPEIGTNLVSGQRDSPDVDPLEGADVVVRGRFVNQRVAVAPMEGNSIAVLPGSSPALTVWAATQMPHRLRDSICSAFGLESEEVHVITPNVGGAFGGKVGLAAEYAAVIAASRVLARPIKWAESRSENLLTMAGRSQVQYGELGFTADGKIVGLRGWAIGDAGAYGGFGGGLAVGPTRSMCPGVYQIPRVRFDAAVALTNTAPVGAFRGAGRPEAASFIERLMDLGADELGIDPAEIRRRNFISRRQFPYQTVTGMLYDSGDYELVLDRALEISGYENLLKEQTARRKRGDRVQLGIGISTYVEVTAGGRDGEFGSVEVHRDGTATARVGTAASGQGHATAFSMVVADRLGIAIENIKFVQADTGEVLRGGGTGGSRSLQLGGVALGEAAKVVVDQARDLAADLLEADPADITLFDDGRIGVTGVPATALSWADVADAAAERDTRLFAEHDFVAEGATFPFGAHVSVVEVDTETGRVVPVRHVAVDDAGTVINPLLIAGQQHGGIAQGMSQALWELSAYDGDANPVSGSFATYCIPSAAEVCSYEASSTETPTPYNPLGAKGIGEAATIGATPAVQNAVVDALSHLGIRHLDMPITPERVWRALGAARNGVAFEAWREPPDIFGGLSVRAPRTVTDADEEAVSRPCHPRTAPAPLRARTIPFGGKERWRLRLSMEPMNYFASTLVSRRDRVRQESRFQRCEVCSHRF